MRLGIDASNIGIGGGITHLKEILPYLAENKSVQKTTVFASQKILDQLPDYKDLIKITFPELNKGLVHRVLFQLFKYDSFVKNNCDVLFSITGDYLGSFKPVVGMSRNMLLYERDIWKEIKQPQEIIRFWINYLKQKRCFKNSSGIIFISNYAESYISRKINLTGKQTTIINHGISTRFKFSVREQLDINLYTKDKPFKLLYVSTVHVYKHQWNVIEAVSNLRKKGYRIELDLVGGVIFKPAGKRLSKSIEKVDLENEFIHYYNHVPYNKIDEFYKKANGIVYASTCENMPNILIESMASGLPIACSNKEPMPEFLKNNGYYFNSRDIESITNAIERMLLNPNEREVMCMNNIYEVRRYTWEVTANKTFEFLKNIYKQYYHV